MWYWNQSRNSFRTGESQAHRHARYILKGILERQAFGVDFGDGESGYRLPEIFPELDRPKPFTVDIFACDSNSNKLYIEIDGTIHFANKYQKGKTDKKHAQIKECLNIVLIHLTPEDCVGKYALSDVDIWLEIMRQYHAGQRELIFDTFNYR